MSLWNIRELQKSSDEEKARIVEIVRLCYRGKGNWTNESHLVCGDRTDMERLESELEDSTILVATLAEGKVSRRDIVGCIKTGLVQKTVVCPLDEPTGYIGLFAVHPEFGSRGIGNDLMHAAEEFCRSRGASHMALVVLSQRKDIINYYLRKGYEIVPNKSVPAKPFIEAQGEELLVDCSFILMKKVLSKA